MSLSRRDVEEYVRYAERLSDDLKVCLSDLRFRKRGGRVHLAIDFSEIHSFLLPSTLPDDWLWPGLDESAKALVEHCALSEVLTGRSKPILLQPYAVEFQTFLSNQAAAQQGRTLEEGSRAFDELDTLMQSAEAQQMLELAVRVDKQIYKPTPEDLAAAVRFFEGRAANLVSIVRGEVLYPLQRAKAFLETGPFRALDSIAQVQLSGNEPEVLARFKRLKSIRGGERDGATFIDAVAVEYIRRANQTLMRNKANAHVLLVSRSSALHRLIVNETSAGLWPELEHGVLRHPRVFAPLSWVPRDTAADAIEHFEQTQASLDLCNRSARLRLAGSWASLERGRADRGLVEQISALKAQIFNLTQMGGGINESRLLLKKNRATEHEVLRLLAMLRNRDEVLSAVADRMKEIKHYVDRSHELVGMLLHIEDAVGGAILLERPARGVRLVIPRMGRLPYGLRFKTKRFRELLDEFFKKPAVTHDDVRDLLVRATEDTADHYETLLFMAYTLALLGRYELAAQYCERALQSAERHGGSEIQEGRFFQALCLRVLAAEPDELRKAIGILDAIGGDQPDARHFAEQGNIRIRWYELALEGAKWRNYAPGLEEVTVWLEKAIATAADDLRVLASAQNSLCYFLTNAYERDPTEQLHRRANEALHSLMNTLDRIEPDSDQWPVRIKDTIAKGMLTLNRPLYDAALLQALVRQIKANLESDLVAADRKLLEDRLKDYERALTKL